MIVGSNQGDKSSSLSPLQEGQSGDEIVLLDQHPTAHTLKIVVTAEGALRGCVEGKWKSVEGLNLRSISKEMIPQVKAILQNSWFSLSLDTIVVHPRLRGGGQVPSAVRAISNTYKTLEAIVVLNEAGRIPLGYGPVDSLFRSQTSIEPEVLEKDLTRQRNNEFNRIFCVGLSTSQLSASSLEDRIRLMESSLLKFNEVLRKEKLDEWKACLASLRGAISPEGVVDQGILDEGVQNLKDFKLEEEDVSANLNMISNRMTELQEKLQVSSSCSQQMIEVGEVGVSILSQALAFKNPKLSRTVNVVGKTGIKIADSVRQLCNLKSGYSLIDFIQPAGAITQGILLLAQLITQNEERDLQEEISSQIKSLTTFVVQSFQENRRLIQQATSKMGVMHEEVMKELDEISLEIQRVELLVEKLGTLSNQQFNVLYSTVLAGQRNAFTYHFDELELLARTGETHNTIDQGSFLETSAKFVVWATQFSSHEIVTTHPEGPPEWQINTIARASTRSPSQYVNIELWARSVEGYLRHRSFWKHKSNNTTERYFSPDEVNHFAAFLSKGNEVRKFLKDLAKDTSYFNRLIDEYETTLNLLRREEWSDVQAALYSSTARLHPLIDTLDRQFKLLTTSVKLAFSNSVRLDPLFALLLTGDIRSPYILLSKRGLEGDVSQIGEALCTGCEAIKFFRRVITYKIGREVNEEHAILSFMMEKLLAIGREFYPDNNRIFRERLRNPSPLPENIVLGEFMLEDIHHAARMGNLGHLEGLLTRNPHLIDARDSLGRSPLHYAALGGRTEVVALLQARGAAPTSEDLLGLTPADLAKTNRIEFTKLKTIPDSQFVKKYEIEGFHSRKCTFINGALLSSRENTPLRINDLATGRELWQAPQKGFAATTYLQFVIFQAQSGKIEVRELTTNRIVPNNLPTFQEDVVEFQVLENILLVKVAGAVHLYRLTTRPEEWHLLKETKAHNARLLPGGLLFVTTRPIEPDDPLSTSTMTDIFSGKTLFRGKTEGDISPVSVDRGRIAWVEHIKHHMHTHENLVVWDFDCGRELLRKPGLHLSNSWNSHGDQVAILGSESHECTVHLLNLSDLSHSALKLGIDYRPGTRFYLSVNSHYFALVSVDAQALSPNLQDAKFFDISTGDKRHQIKNINVKDNGGALTTHVLGNQLYICQDSLICYTQHFE